MVRRIKFDFSVIILSLGLLTLLFLIHWYLTSLNDLSNSKIIVSCDNLIKSEKLDRNYYLLYDHIDVKFNNVDFSLVYTFISSVDIFAGRNINNDFEVILSEKYKGLLNKKIILEINENRYEFLVVGIYNNSKVINDKYIYTSKDTLEYLYHNYNIGKYNYMFVINSYNDLNTTIDVLRKDGYDLAVSNSNSLVRINNYNIVKDSVMLLIVVVIAVILVFIFQVIF